MYIRVSLYLVPSLWVTENVWFCLAVIANHYSWEAFLTVEETPLNQILAGYMPVSETPWLRCRSKGMYQPASFLILRSFLRTKLVLCKASKWNYNGVVHTTLSTLRKKKEMVVWPHLIVCFGNASTTLSDISRMRAQNKE